MVYIFYIYYVVIALEAINDLVALAAGMYITCATASLTLVFNLKESISCALLSTARITDDAVSIVIDSY